MKREAIKLTRRYSPGKNYNRLRRINVLPCSIQKRNFALGTIRVFCPSKKFAYYKNPQPHIHTIRQKLSIQLDFTLAQAWSTNPPPFPSIQQFMIVITLNDEVRAKRFGFQERA